MLPKWIQIVLVIGIFFVVAAFVERRRLSALQQWRRTTGFTALDPFVPADHPHIRMLAAQLTGNDNLRWADGMTGKLGDTEVTFTQFSYTPTGRKTSSWFTLAVWPSTQVPGPLVITHNGPGFMGISKGSVFIDGEDSVKQAWLTEKRRLALDAWPHGGQFLLLGNHVGWVTEGLLTATLADQRIAQLAEARRFLQ